MRTRYLLLHPAEAATADRLARPLEPVAEILGLDVYTTRQTLIGTGVRRLALSEDQGELEARAAKLAALGMQVLVIAEHEIEQRRPVRVRGVARDGRAMALTGLEGRQVGRLAPEERVLAVPTHLRNPDDILRGRALPDCVTADTVLHLFDERGGWYTLHPTGFNYNTLDGDRRGSVVANLKAFTDRLSESVAGVTWHLGHPANYDRPVGEDLPDRYAQWTCALWQAGRLQHAAAPGATDTAAREGLRRGTGSQREVLTAVPLRRRSLNWRSGAKRSLTPFNLGVLIYVGTILLALLGTQLRGVDHAAFLSWLMGGVLALAGALTLAFGVRQLQRWQRIADLPTARVRSVAMGPAELTGTARADVSIASPYTRIACAWYELRVERQRPWHPIDGFARQRGWGGLLAMAGFGGRPMPWKLVVEGDSGDLPFWLEDDTGRIRVDPRGAVWQLRDRDVYEVDSDDLRHRVTERVLADGAPLYVLGTVTRDEPDALDRRRQVIEELRRIKHDPQALAGYDIDGDGRIDEEEWAQARKAVEMAVAAEHATRTKEDTVCIGAGQPGDVFIISDRDEVELARRLRLFAYGGLLLGAAAAMYGGVLILG